MDLSVAAAHVLGDAGAFAGQLGRRAARSPSWAGTRGLGRVPRGRRGRRPRVVRRGRAPARRAAHPGGRLPHRRARSRPRRHALGLAQPRAGQRHQVPRPGRLQAARRGRERDRAAARREVGAPCRRRRRPGARGVRRGRPLRLAPAVHRRPAASTACDVVVDCAHGAAHMVAPEALLRAGATVEAIGARPDGLNINDGCGSTHLDKLQQVVVSRGADVGIAYDGDADRCLAVTAHRRGRRRRPDHGDPGARPCTPRAQLAEDTVVATVMSNLGFKIAMRERRHRRDRDRRGRPLRPGGHEGRAATTSAASSPATSSCSTTPPPATAC